MSSSRSFKKQGLSGQGKTANPLKRESARKTSSDLKTSSQSVRAAYQKTSKASPSCVESQIPSEAQKSKIREDVKNLKDSSGSLPSQQQKKEKSETWVLKVPGESVETVLISQTSIVHQKKEKGALYKESSVWSETTSVQLKMGGKEKLQTLGVSVSLAQKEEKIELPDLDKISDASALEAEEPSVSRSSEENSKLGADPVEGFFSAVVGGGGEFSLSLKNFRHHPDLENFYRFIYENDLRAEALAILDQELVLKMHKRGGIGTGGLSGKVSGSPSIGKIGERPTSHPSGG